MRRFKHYFSLGMIICSLVMLVGCDGFQGTAYQRKPDGGIGQTITGVKITFLKEDGSVVKSVITDNTGFYRICLHKGRYVVTATHPAYEDYSSIPGFFVVIGGGYQTGNFFLREPRVTTVLLVRHAEKGPTHPSDDKKTPLTPTGKARAEKLAHVARKAGVTAIYATEFIRTQQTVQPLADSLRLPITPYSSIDVSGLVEEILSDHNGDVVLVAGHSNTVPGIAQKLGADITATQPVNNNDYDNLFVVTRKDAAGTIVANIVNLQYGDTTSPNIARSNHPMPTLLLVRHTEAGAVGVARAEKLAHVVRLAHVNAIFTTSTQQTVQPLAETLNLVINSYPSDGVNGIITQLRADTRQLFVVAGENENISDIIEKLGGYPTPPVFANEYDNLFLITAYELNEAKVLSLQYGEQSR